MAGVRYMDEVILGLAFKKNPAIAGGVWEDVIRHHLTSFSALIIESASCTAIL
jgi:hypothetical protein